MIEGAQCNSELRNVTIIWEVSVLPYMESYPPTPLSLGTHTAHACILLL